MCGHPYLGNVIIPTLTSDCTLNTTEHSPPHIRRKLIEFNVEMEDSHPWSHQEMRCLLAFWGDSTLQAKLDSSYVNSGQYCYL